LADPGISEGIILKWTIKKWDGRAMTESVQLKVGTHNLLTAW
jgi:hypothetical protein